MVLNNKTTRKESFFLLHAIFHMREINLFLISNYHVGLGNNKNVSVIHVGLEILRGTNKRKLRGSKNDIS